MTLPSLAYLDVESPHLVIVIYSQTNDLQKANDSDSSKRGTLWSRIKYKSTCQNPSKFKHFLSDFGPKRVSDVGMYFVTLEVLIAANKDTVSTQ